MQALQIRARLKAHIVQQGLARAAITSEGPFGAAGAVESQHQLPPQPFPEREPDGEFLQGGDRGVVAPGAQQRLEALLVNLRAPLLQPSDRRGGPFLVGDRVERTSPPQRQCELETA